MKSPQRGDIQMIVMRVAKEHRIDWRQIIEVDAGLGYPFRSDEREGTCSLRPNRVSEDIYTRHLNERGCVSHYIVICKPETRPSGFAGVTGTDFGQ